MQLPNYFVHDLRVHLPIELPSLVLRLPTTRDAPAMLEAIDESRVELETWMPWAPSTNTVDALKRYVRRLPSALRSGRNFDFGVFDRDTGKYLGGMGFAKIDPDLGVAEIGYWVRRSARRRGVVTRVVVELVTLGFGTLGLGRIEVRCDDRNHASARIPERLGFRREGLLRGGLPDHVHYGARRDVRVYGLVAADWHDARDAWQREIVERFDAAGDLPGAIRGRTTSELRG